MLHGLSANQPDLHYLVYRMAVKAAFEVPLVRADYCAVGATEKYPPPDVPQFYGWRGRRLQDYFPSDFSLNNRPYQQELCRRARGSKSLI